MVSNLFCIKSFQEQWIEIIGMNKCEYAGTVRVNDSISISGNTALKYTRSGNDAGISNNNTAIGLKDDGIANPKRCPGIVDMLTLHICDDWIIICWSNDATRRLKGISCTRLYICITLYT